MPPPTHLSTRASLSAFLHSSPLAVIDFSAPWCAPCRSIGPFFHSLSQGGVYGDSVSFGEVDTDASPDLAGVYQVRHLSLFPSLPPSPSALPFRPQPPSDRRSPAHISRCGGWYTTHATHESTPAHAFHPPRVNKRRSTDEVDPPTRCSTAAGRKGQTRARGARRPAGMEQPTMDEGQTTDHRLDNLSDIQARTTVLAQS